MISLWDLLTLSFLLFHSPQAVSKNPVRENTFSIRFDPSVKTGELQMRYYITGDFGGSGGYQVDQDGENAIQIRTEVEGKPAKSLKAVLYVAGCRIQTITIVDLSLSSREAEFHCTPVGETRLQGKFPHRPTTPNRSMEVQIQYLGFWAHGFFGIVDGIVLSFDIAKCPVDSDGSFHIYLPNFTERDEFSPQLEDASYRIFVLDTDSGNILAELRPPTSLSSAGNLKVMASYPQTIEFDADWRDASSGN
jgi:hypothetical protein